MFEKEFELIKLHRESAQLRRNVFMSSCRKDTVSQMHWLSSDKLAFNQADALAYAKLNEFII